MGLQRLALAVGSMTFSTAENFVGTLLQQPGPEDYVQENLQEIPRTTIFGLTNLGRMFDLKTIIAAFNASFGTCDNGEGKKHENVLWGTKGMVSCRCSITSADSARSSKRTQRHPHSEAGPAQSQSQLSRTDAELGQGRTSALSQGSGHGQLPPLPPRRREASQCGHA